MRWTFSFYFSNSFVTIVPLKKKNKVKEINNINFYSYGLAYSFHLSNPFITIIPIKRRNKSRKQIT